MIASPAFVAPDLALAADPLASWQRVCQRLRSELGEDVFGAWFARIELEAIDGDCARLSVPTRFLKSWLQSHYNDKLLGTFMQEWPSVTAISIDLRSSLNPLKPVTIVHTPQGAPTNGTLEAKATREQSRPNLLHAFETSRQTGEGVVQPLRRRANEADNHLLSSSPLDRRLTFSTFLMGRSNQLAHAAAQKVAQAQPGEAVVYNPIYIHSNVGLGKTHVLQAIAHAAVETQRRVVYLTAEKFMYGFVSALKAQSAIAFKEALRSIDILIIDDVQFLQGKAIQQEFCHTMNALIDAGKQIIVAADRSPAELESLEERVRSRLAGGLCVEMSSLDEDLRMQILQARINAARQRHTGFQVPTAVMHYVAMAIQTNGRDLEGAVNRLLAHATLTNAPLCVETAEAAIRDLVRTREPKRVKIEDIQKLVATHFNVSRSDILSSRRTAQVVRPRQIAMYLSKILTLRSLPEIGRRFGGRDHTTVLHAVRKIEGLSIKDRDLSEEIELLKRMLQE